MTQRWKLTVEYHGGSFCGWQRQPDQPTVQGAIEDAIKAFSDEVVTLHVAGRTDTGVHAMAQVAHVDLDRETTGETIRDALNFYLRPTRAVILKAEVVSEDFHARFSAIKRHYRYRILNRRSPAALDADQVWHVARLLDENAMQQAADHLLGTHDFSTFRAQNCQATSPIRTLDGIRITRTDDLITTEVSARSFLYHQVRNMVGTLSLVGSGSWSFEDFAVAFAAKDRQRGGPTAPPQGLCLTDITYPQ